MNHEMIELNDEQLDMVAGGSGSFINLQNVGSPQININAIANVVVAPTIAVTLWSKDVTVVGAYTDIINQIRQKI